MASLHYAKSHDRWRVRWRTDDGTHRARNFKTREEAAAFRDAGIPDEHLKYAPSPGSIPRPGRPPRTAEEVVAHVAANIVVDENGCHLWQRDLTNAGYAKLNWKYADDEIARGGHRAIFTAVHGPIPPGLVIDHLCRVRHCVNIDHLDLVSQRENVMRSPITIAYINASKTHCPQGHAYDETNTIPTVHKNGTTHGRLCRACQTKRGAA